MASADQSPVFFDILSNVTVDKKGAELIIVGSTVNEKSCITVILGVTAYGRKLPPYVILKRKVLSKEKLPPGVVVRAQEKAWMTEEFMAYWLKHCWGQQPGLD